jgi:hypothetical protein
MVASMLKTPRRIFHRTTADSTATDGSLAAQPAPEPAVTDPARHPAMRGLNVSPVHGRHCICNRCAPRRAA